MPKFEVWDKVRYVSWSHWWNDYSNPRNTKWVVTRVDESRHSLPIQVMRNTGSPNSYDESDLDFYSIPTEEMNPSLFPESKETDSLLKEMFDTATKMKHPEAETPIIKVKWKVVKKGKVIPPVPPVSEAEAVEEWTPPTEWTPVAAPSSAEDMLEIIKKANDIVKSGGATPEQAKDLSEAMEKAFWPDPAMLKPDPGKTEADPANPSEWPTPPPPPAPQPQPEPQPRQFVILYEDIYKNKQNYYSSPHNTAYEAAQEFLSYYSSEFIILNIMW